MLFAAAATFAAFPILVGAQESTPRPTPTPAPCARPNVAATTVRGAPAIAPPMAEQQGIRGTVQVVISLDEYSRVVGARIQTSPSAILNPAALAAARASTFQPPSVVVPFRLVPVVGGFTQPQVRVPEVQTRAAATVTYTIKP
jgi:TonB family protein